MKERPVCVRFASDSVTPCPCPSVRFSISGRDGTKRTLPEGWLVPPLALFFPTIKGDDMQTFTLEADTLATVQRMTDAPQ